MRGSFGAIGFMVLLSLPADAAPQRPDSTYRKALALELPSLPPPVAVHYSPGYGDRAAALQRGARAVHDLLRDSLGLAASDLTLLVLDSADWSEATELPYGLHTLLQDAPVFLAPSLVDRGIYHDDAVGERDAELGVDVVGLHYLAHFYSAHALYDERHREDPPVKWLDELFTLMLQDELLRVVDPALAEAAARQEAKSLRLDDPAVTTLAGFDREYRRAFVTREGADDYAWFLTRLAGWAREIRGEHGLRVIGAVREALARAPAELEPEAGLDLLARVGVDVSGDLAGHDSTVSSAAVIAPVLDGGRLLLEIRPRGVGRLFFIQSYNAEPVPDLAWRNEPGPGGYFRLIEDDSVLVLEQLDFDVAPTDASRGAPAVTAAAVLPILRRESGTGLLVADGSDLFLDPPEAYGWAVWGVEFGPFDPFASEVLRASSSDVSFNIHVTHTFEVPGDSGSAEDRSVRVPIAYRGLLLPETPARPRPCDPQIGVWHRPNPRADDENACMIYHRPLTTEPIVFYIDPDTPERWVPWVMRGVEMWEPTFRAAGWHDAIQARLPPTPEEDPDFDVYDLRHSVIYWNPWNDYAWGSHWSDPRSGEILRGAARIGGGYARSVHAKVWAEAGAAEDDARSLPMPDSLLGFELAGLVAHEVGHTMGLGHNLPASAYVPVDSLRSRSFTCSEGPAPTVMDYTPNNYVAQPGDGACTRSRRMGSWDYEVIRWLYGRTESSRSGVGTASGAVGPYRWTPPGSGSAGAQPFDHRTVLHTLGDDPIRATGYGLVNIGRLAGALPLYGSRDSAATAEAMPSAAELFERLVLTWQRQLAHVVALVGDPNVEPSRQREAVRFLLEHAFVPPRFLLTDELTALLPQPPAQVVGEAQRTLLGSLLSESRLAHLDSLERAGRTDFGADELMAQLSAGLFEPGRRPSAGDSALRRALVDFYMERRRSLRPPDARPPPRSDLIQVRSDAMVSPAPDGRLLSYVDWETGDIDRVDRSGGTDDPL